MSQSPFKFLDSYTREDHDIYFGRTNETEALYTAVFKSKMVLLYGVSGTGKSSLIQCGLANKFQESDWLPVFVRRRTDMLDSLFQSLIQTHIEAPRLPKKRSAKSFLKLLQSLYLDHFKPVYLIFDQFEELFIFGNKEERSEFVQLMEALQESEVQVKVIFSIREEYLAMLTEFEDRLPELFQNRIRVERMHFPQAKEVIQGACQYANIEIEEGFEEQLLEKLTGGKKELELTYLQVLLDRLWKKSEEGKNGFTLTLLESMGHISDLLGQFLEEQINELEEPEQGLTVLKTFVSVQGTKKQLTFEEINQGCLSLGQELDEKAIQDLLHRFTDLRILRDKDESGRYELRHDSLAAKIYEKITLAEKELMEVRQFVEQAYDNYQKREILLSQEDLDYVQPYLNKLFLEQKFKDFLEESKKELLKAKRRRQTLIIAATAVLMAILVGFSWWAISERKKAELKEVQVKALYFNSLASEIKKDDPTQAFRVAQFAHDLDSNNRKIKQNLLDIYYNNPLKEEIIKFNEKDDFIDPRNVQISHNFSLMAVLINNKEKMIVFDQDSVISEFNFSNDERYSRFCLHPIDTNLCALSYSKRRLVFFDIQGNKIKSLVFKDSLDSIEKKRKNYLGVEKVSFSNTSKYIIISFNSYETSRKYKTYSVIYSSDGEYIDMVNGFCQFGPGDDAIFIKSPENKLISWPNKKIISTISVDKYTYSDERYIFQQNDVGVVSVYNYLGEKLEFEIPTLHDKTINIDYKNQLIYTRAYGTENSGLIVRNFKGKVLQLIPLEKERNTDCFILDRNILFWNRNRQFSYQDHVFYKINTMFIPQLLFENQKVLQSINKDYLFTLKKDSINVFDNSFNLIKSVINPISSDDVINCVDIDKNQRLFILTRNSCVYKIDQNNNISLVKKVYDNDVIFKGLINLKKERIVLVNSPPNTLNSKKIRELKIIDTSGNIIYSKKVNLYSKFIVDFQNKPFLLISDSGYLNYLSFDGDSLYSRYVGNRILSNSKGNSYNIINVDLKRSKLFEIDASGNSHNYKDIKINKDFYGNIITKPSSDKFFLNSDILFEYDQNGFMHNRILKMDYSSAVFFDDYILYNEDNDVYYVKLKPEYKNNRIPVSIAMLDLDIIDNQNILSQFEINHLLKDYPIDVQFNYFLNKITDEENIESIDEYKAQLKNIVDNQNLNQIDYFNYFNFIREYGNSRDIKNFISRVENKQLDSIFLYKLASISSDASYDCIIGKKFDKAIIFAKLSKKANPRNNILYTNLALSYLLLDNWENAKEIYETYQDSTYNDGTKTNIKQSFLEDINEMERLGITHPDFQKVRELLGATEDKEVEQEKTTENE